MIRLELARLIRGRLWRWTIGVGLSLGIGLLSLHWLSTYHARSTANVFDLVLAGVSQFYVATVILPVYFLFVVGDMATGDLEGYAAFLAGRIPNRMAWWGGKAIALAVGAALVLLTVVGVLVAVGLMAGLPLRLTWSPYVYQGGAYEMGKFAGSSLADVWPGGPLVAVGEFTALALGTFLSLGWGVLAVALRLRNILMPWLLGMVAASVTYAVWMVRPAAIRWMPTAQMMLLQHVPRPYAMFFGRNPILWSLGYITVASVIGALGGLCQARTMDLNSGVSG